MELLHIHLTPLIKTVFCSFNFSVFVIVFNKNSLSIGRYEVTLGNPYLYMYSGKHPVFLRWMFMLLCFYLIHPAIADAGDYDIGNSKTNVYLLTVYFVKSRLVAKSVY